MKHVTARQPLFTSCLACLLAIGGCATRSSDLPSATQNGQGNATVRAVAYVAAAPNANPPSRALGFMASPARKNGKRDTARSAARDKPVVASTVPDTGKSPGTAVPINDRAPLAATGWRYTYVVDLDSGGTQRFGFADDQRLRIADRVLVNGSTLVVPRD